MLYDAVPPFLASSPLVTILIEPPTEGADTFEAPSPRCVCMLRVTSVSPIQLLQYSPPHSMSFMGTPLTITATLALWNPRMLIFESPNPPPAFVAYTPGVDFRISGNSFVPIFSSMNTGSMVERATGVLRATATDWVMTTSPSATASGFISIVPMLLRVALRLMVS